MITKDAPPSSAPPVLGVSHIALPTPDLAAFWTGFEVILDTPELFTGIDRPSPIAGAVTSHGDEVDGVRFGQKDATSAARTRPGQRMPRSTL